MDVYVVCKSFAFPFNNFRIMLPFVAVQLLSTTSKCDHIICANERDHCAQNRHSTFVRFGECVPNSSYAH